MSKRGASSHRSGQDWTSFLPDPLLCQILSDLPTKNAVKTSILSTRWRYIWLSIPLLDLNIDDFPDYTTFASFVSRFLEKLISSCPVLEDLTIVRNVDETVKVLRVRSQTLNSLKLVLDSSKSWYIDDSDDWEVLIDAPRLTYLSLEDDQSVSFVISSLGSAAKVEIAVSFNVNGIWDLDESAERNSSVGKLLNGLSSVRDMTISGTTLKIICQYMNLERVPHFHNMTRLETKFYMTDLKLLPEFLESCPNLQSLVLKLKGVTCKDETSFSSMPKCFQSSLEYVEMTRPNCASGLEMKLVKYFLENSLVLKKFTLRFHCSIKEQEQHRYGSHEIQEM